MSALSGHTVLITGASAGIGKACAEKFAESGCRMLLAARRANRLETLAAHLRSEFGVDVFILDLDVSDAVAVAEAVQSLPEAWQEVDILVNNAGKALGLGPSFRASLEEIDGMLDTNVKGLLYVNRAIVPGMIERNRGHIITIGSVAGRWVYNGGTVYCASKHAVRAINEGLKMDVHGSAVRVTSVDPGLVETEFSIVRFKGDEEKAARVYRGMRPLSAEDVAETVHYCAARPPHVNILEVSMMCVDQSSPTLVRRDDQ